MDFVLVDRLADRRRVVFHEDRLGLRGFRRDERLLDFGEFLLAFGQTPLEVEAFLALGVELFSAFLRSASNAATAVARRSRSRERRTVSP